MHAVRLLRLAGGVFAQAGLHAQLARVEWAEEQSRLLKMVWVVLLGFACVLSAMLSAGALVLALCWETAYRIPAAVGLIALYGLGAGIAWARFRALSVLGDQSFAASRTELAADLDVLQGSR